MSDKQNYFFNAVLARALIPLIPIQEREKAYHWLAKLNTMVEEEELDRRKEYIWALLLMLQNGSLMAPFNQLPPTDALQKLDDVLPPDDLFLNQVSNAGDLNFSWVEKVLAEESGARQAAGAPRPVPPARFLDAQPEPLFGTVCYMAAFCDRDHFMGAVGQR